MNLQIGCCSDVSSSIDDLHTNRMIVWNISMEFGGSVLGAMHKVYSKVPEWGWLRNNYIVQNIVVVVISWECTFFDTIRRMMNYVSVLQIDVCVRIRAKKSPGFNMKVSQCPKLTMHSSSWHLPTISITKQYVTNKAVPIHNAYNDWPL